jgi:oligoendopeptidase F
VSKVETLTNLEDRVRLFRACSEARERYYSDELEVHQILVEKRQAMAQAAGHANYAAFRFSAGFSKPNSDQALELARAVRTEVGALLKQVRARWSTKHYPLKPWHKIKELAVAPPPEFWTDAKQAAVHLATTLKPLNPGFAPVIERIFEQGNVDIERRPHKAQITRMFYFPNERASFVLHSSGWGPSGYADLLHELGHVIHGELLDLRGARFFEVNPDYPSGEFVAFTVEYLGLRLSQAQSGAQIDEVYESAELERMLTNFVHIAAMEEICHYIYRSPQLPEPESIDRKWLEIATYAEGLDWSEDLERLKRQWLHYFVVGMPFETLDYLEGLTASLWVVAEYLRVPKETRELFTSLTAVNLGMEAIFDRLGHPYPLRKQTVTALCNLLIKRYQALAG